jgi:hypothetical protein
VQDGPFWVSANADGSWTQIGGSLTQMLARIIPAERRLRQPFADRRKRLLPRDLSLWRCVQILLHNINVQGKPL